MLKDRVVRRLGSVGGRTLAVVVVGLGASLGTAGPVSAQSLNEPFAVFGQCPRFARGVNFCSYAQIESGGARIGNGGLLVVNPITLQGGYERNEEKEPVTERFVGALDGETLSRTPQPIPGGLAGLISCEEIQGKDFLARAFRRVCQAILQNPSLTALNATTELAGAPENIGISTDNLVNEKGIAFSLPVKIHLESRLLGGECYIGSDRRPIILNLTDGTTNPPPPNTPIAGTIGDFNVFESADYPHIEYVEDKGATLVDNSFAVPGVNGCGGFFSSLLDPILDAKLGLPAPAGYNTILYNITSRLATAEDLIKLENGESAGQNEEEAPPRERWHHHRPGQGRWR